MGPPYGCPRIFPTWSIGLGGCRTKEGNFREKSGHDAAFADRWKNLVLHRANPPKTATDFSKVTTVGPNVPEVCQTLAQAANPSRIPRNVQIQNTAVSAGNKARRCSAWRRHQPINQSQRNQANIEQKAGGGGENVVDLLSD